MNADRHFIGTPEKEDIVAPSPTSPSIVIDRDDLIRDLLHRIEQLEKRVNYITEMMKL